MYENLQHLGLLSIVIGWISMLILVTKWRGNKSMSFSGHAAKHRSAYFMMAIMESIFLPMYLVFIATWFSNTFSMHLAFVALNAIAVTGLLIAAWVPDVVGLRGKIHKGVAFPAYSCMILASLFLIFSNQIAFVPRLFSALAFLYMLAAGYFLVNSRKRNDNYLIYQGSFLASIHLSVLLATYIR